jgi:hypothetical protein
MDFDQTELNELTRKAAELTLETADVSRLLRVRLGPEHDLAKSAEEMLGSLESFLRALRCFPGSPDDERGGAARRVTE